MKFAAMNHNIGAMANTARLAFILTICYLLKIGFVLAQDGISERVLLLLMGGVTGFYVGWYATARIQRGQIRGMREVSYEQAQAWAQRLTAKKR